MNRVNTISIKILDGYFEDSIKLILKFICKKKIVKTILKEENKTG